MKIKNKSESASIRFALQLFVCLTFIGIQTSVATADQKNGQWTKESAKGVSFWMYRPASIENESALMVNLHGCVQTADTLKEFGNWEKAAERFKMTVVIPYVPNGGVVRGCWDYYGKDQNETNKHNGPLIALTESLLQNKQLLINPQHVFISGLSSGAGQAMIMGCVRPDLYHGVGFNAGPIVGSEMMEIYRPQITATEAASFCTQLAGSHASAFASQRFSIILDAADPTVNPLHSDYALKAISSIYGALTPLALDLTRLEGTNTEGVGSIYLSGFRSNTSYFYHQKYRTRARLARRR